MSKSHAYRCLANRWLQQYLESRDLLHEAMVEAIRSFSQFEALSEHALLAWFARIVENRIRNTVEFQRAAKRDRANEVVLDHLRSTAGAIGAVPEPADARTQPFESLARKERADVVAECLAELPEDRRSVVELRNRDRLSWEDVASGLGSGTPQAARMLYARALVDLKESVLRRLGSD